MKKLILLICISILKLSGYCRDIVPLENAKAFYQKSELNLKNKFGVGFRTFLLSDLSRPPIKEQPGINAKEKGRVIQMNLWYPASISNSTKLSFKDYLILKGNETDSTLTEQQKEFLAKSILSKNYNTTTDTISQLFKSNYQFKGIKNSPFLSEKFPLIVMLHNDPVGFAPLAEQLSSYGFVVVNFPVTGTSSKNFDWETIAGVETELRDMDFVVKEITRMGIIDSTCIIPLGYSYGAMAALAYQIRNNNVKAIISLDGGIGSMWGGNLLFNLPDFNISQLKKPVFHAWSDLEKGYDHKWLDNYICCERYLMKFSKLRHGDFVEGIIFEQIVPGITSKVSGKLVIGNEIEFKKLIESITWFALWISTGDNSYERQFKNINLPYSKLTKWSCINNLG